MIFLNSTSWALDVGWQVEIVLHEGLVQEWLSHLKTMSSSGSVDSEHIELVELLHESL